MKQYVCGKLRFTALSEDVFRIEYGKFEDRNTFNIPARENFVGAEFDVSEQGETIVFSIGGLSVRVRKGDKNLASLKVFCGDEIVYKHTETANTGELPPAHKTPEIFVVTDKPRMILPTHGYSKESVEKGERLETDYESTDIYLIYAHKDFKKLRKNYILLTGAPEMPTLSALGLIFSKYHEYTQEEATEEIKKFVSHGVPLDTLVIDTDWREKSDLTFGCGYNVNTTLFPDLKGFFEFAHKNGVEIMFNDHPVPTRSHASVFQADELFYRVENLTKYLEMGLDIWWFDRNWSFAFKYDDQPVSKEVMGMYVYTDITEKHYRRLAKNDKIYKRPVICANISQIVNGTYTKIEESASHRYPFQWSGDTHCDNDFLCQEVANMIKSANSMISYYSSDIGGHMGSPDKEGFIRWYQYGCLSPIMRPHRNNTSPIDREPWCYDDECFEITKNFVKMRYALLPVFYTRAFRNYSDGLGVISPVEFYYPDDKKTYGDTQSYMVGENLLVSPITNGRQKEYLTKKFFIGKVSAKFFANKELHGEPILTRRYDAIDFFVPDGDRIEYEVPPYDFSAIFEGKVHFNDARKIFVESDDGVRIYIDGALVMEDWSNHGMRESFVFETEAGRTYDIKVEYYQAGNEAGLKIYSYNEDFKPNRRYIPEGKWFNVFTGKKIVGGKSIDVTCTSDKMPIFVKSGALLTLSDDPKNAKSGLFDKLIIDFYPSYDGAFTGEYYEDDGVTTAYKYGEYLTYNTTARYDENENKFIVELGAGVGGYIPERKTKRLKFKINLTEKIVVKDVKINGESVKFKSHNRKKGVYPFVDEQYSPCFKTVTFKSDKKYDEKMTVEILCENNQ